MVKEFKVGATISYLNNKYGVSGWGTISRCNKEYDQAILSQDNRGKRKNQQEFEDIDILKKSYALLMEIRFKQHKQKNIKLLINLEMNIQYQKFMEY